MEAYSRLVGYLEKAVMSFSILCFAVMTFCGGAQVFSRYVFNMSLDWTEEVARFMFIFTTLLGSSLCVKKMNHINVDLFLVRATPKVQRWMEIFVVFVSCLLFAVMFWYGIEIVVATMDQFAPSTDVSMGLVYLVVPVSGLLMILFSVENLVHLIQKEPEGRTLEGAE
jgi:TRAP-type C4-dicarboxylate transport system permease small subunit